jgi:hypothetical protein
MELLKIENYNYHILYVNDNEKYDIYRRFDEVTWQIFRRNEWKPLQDYLNLETMFNEQMLNK